MVIVFSDSAEQSKQYWAGKYPLILLRDRQAERERPGPLMQFGGRHMK